MKFKKFEKWYEVSNILGYIIISKNSWSKIYKKVYIAVDRNQGVVGYFYIDSNDNTYGVLYISD